MLFERFFLGVGILTPPTFYALLEKEIFFAGHKSNTRYWGGVSVFSAFAVFFLFLLAAIVLNVRGAELFTVLLVLLLSFVFMLVGPLSVFLVFYFIADSRSEEAIKHLPNALNLIGANIRSGVTPFHAVKSAGISQFGVLGKEIKNATSRSLGTRPYTYYLVEMAKSFKNPAVERSLRLFTSSIKAGGKLTTMLEQLAADLTDRRALKNELMTHMKTNVVFIMFIVAIGTPSLLAISIYFLDTITEIQSDNAGVLSGAGGFGGLTGQVTITSDFLLNLAWFMLGLTALFACFFLGAVKDGDFKKGLKLSPILIGASYILFILSRWVVNYILA